jgi:hypothetical protein
MYVKIVGSILAKVISSLISCGLVLLCLVDQFQASKLMDTQFFLYFSYINQVYGNIVFSCILLFSWF